MGSQTPLAFRVVRSWDTPLWRLNSRRWRGRRSLCCELGDATRGRRCVVEWAATTLLFEDDLGAPGGGEGSLRCRVRSLVIASACATAGQRGVRLDRREIGRETGGGADCGGRQWMLALAA
jgi:hypothetical protein